MANPYKKTLWIPHVIELDEWGNPVIDPETGKPVVLVEGTRFTATRANNIEDGIYNLYDLLAEQQRINQRQDIKLLLMDRASSGLVFYDTLDGQPSSKIALDTATADITKAVIAGTTVLNVSKTDGFKAFTEVTVYDDANHEDVMVMSIDAEAKTITVQPLTNGYKKGAQICRSNVMIDPVQQQMQIGQWGTFSVAVSEVV